MKNYRSIKQLTIRTNLENREKFYYCTCCYRSSMVSMYHIQHRSKCKLKYYREPIFIMQKEMRIRKYAQMISSTGICTYGYALDAIYSLLEWGNK